MDTAGDENLLKCAIAYNLEEEVRANVDRMIRKKERLGEKMTVEERSEWRKTEQIMEGINRYFDRRNVTRSVGVAALILCAFRQLIQHGIEVGRIGVNDSKMPKDLVDHCKRCWTVAHAQVSGEIAANIKSTAEVLLRGDT